MTGTDAELYLRLAGERALASRDGSAGPTWDGPVMVAARALVAVGAVEAPVARQVVEDYELAVELRAGGPGPRRQTRAASAASAPGSGARPVPAALPVPRMTLCDTTITLPSATIRVRSVSVSPRSVSVGVDLTAPGALSGRGGWPPGIQLTDDRGVSVPADFSGGGFSGGSDHEWRGRYRSDTPLAGDTRWVEVEGERIDLDDRPPSARVTVAGLPAGDPAMRYLWRQVAGGRRYYVQGEGRWLFQAAVDALAAVGAIDPGSPELADLWAVLDALADPHPPGRDQRLPEPWRSLLARRGRGDGPVGEVAVGAATPPLDRDVSVLVAGLRSGPEEFEIEVEMTGFPMNFRPFAAVADESQDLVWWAADDRGNRYLGEPGRWASTPDGSAGTIEFWPALDPRAAVLELMPTAVTEQAVITVPLPWAAAR